MNKWVILLESTLMTYFKHHITSDTSVNKCASRCFSPAMAQTVSSVKLHKVYVDTGDHLCAIYTAYATFKATYDLSPQELYLPRVKKKFLQCSPVYLFSFLSHHSLCLIIIIVAMLHCLYFFAYQAHSW